MARGNGNASADFSACATAQRAVWFAYQDGSGPWTVVPNVNNVYHFTISSGKGGYAYVTASSTSLVAVAYASQTELSVNNVFCGTTGGANTINGSVAGLGSGQQAEVSYDNGATDVATNGNFTIPQVASGLGDLLGYRSSILSGPSASDRIILRRDQTIANGGTAAVMDFGSGEAFAPTSGTITVSGTGGNQVVAIASYLTGAACRSGLMYELTGLTSPFTANNWWPCRTAQQRATDFHQLILGVTSGSNTLETNLTFHSMVSQTIALPTPIGTPSVAVLTGNYKRLQATFVAPSDYNAGAELNYSDPSNTESVSIFATANYLGTSSVVLTMPVFSGIAGWVDTWAPPTASLATWSVAAAGSSVGLSGSTCQEGARTVYDSYANSGTKASRVPLGILGSLGPKFRPPGQSSAEEC